MWRSRQTGCCNGKMYNCFACEWVTENSLTHYHITGETTAKIIRISQGCQCSDTNEMPWPPHHNAKQSRWNTELEHSSTCGKLTLSKEKRSISPGWKLRTRLHQCSQCWPRGEGSVRALVRLNNRSVMQTHKHNSDYGNRIITTVYSRCITAAQCLARMLGTMMVTAGYQVTLEQTGWICGRLGHIQSSITCRLEGGNLNIFCKDC